MSEHAEISADTGTPRYLIQVKPKQILELQGELRDRYGSPKAYQVRMVRGFATSLARLGHLGDQLTPDQWHLFFWPHSVQNIARNERAAREWMTELSKDLFQATAFQVSAEMMQTTTDIYLQTAESVKNSERIEEPELPAEHGFMWFDSPLMMTDGRGKQISTRAVTWGTTQVKFKGQRTGQMTSATGVRIALWDYKGDPGTPADWHDEYGDLQFTHLMTIPFGQRMAGDIPEVEPGIRADNALHYVHILWQLMDAEITATARHRVDRSTGRHTRSIMHGEVNVITLRRVHSPEPDNEEHAPVAVDWTCRWPVQGHYRHIEPYEDKRHHFIVDRDAGAARDGHPLCVKCGKKGTWVKAFIKGPEGAPLKQTKRVYRLSR